MIWAYGLKFGVVFPYLNIMNSWPWASNVLQQSFRIHTLNCLFTIYVHIARMDRQIGVLHFENYGMLKYVARQNECEKKKTFST